jgi:hypothetical protein
LTGALVEVTTTEAARRERIKVDLIMVDTMAFLRFPPLFRILLARR